MPPTKYNTTSIIESKLGIGGWEGKGVRYMMSTSAIGNYC
jgi:hypothetical protein